MFFLCARCTCTAYKLLRRILYADDNNDHSANAEVLRIPEKFRTVCMSISVSQQCVQKQHFLLAQKGTEKAPLDEIVYKLFTMCSPYLRQAF